MASLYSNDVAASSFIFLYRASSALSSFMLFVAPKARPEMSEMPLRPELYLEEEEEEEFPPEPPRVYLASWIPTWNAEFFAEYDAVRY